MPLGNAHPCYDGSRPVTRPVRVRHECYMDILIVEDDQSVARFLERAVTEAGYGACVTGDGLHALELALRQDFDLILLDVMLPGLDGFQVCRRIRAARIAVSILIITARDTLDDKIAGLDSGADDYIVKPFQLGELLARVRALNRRATSPMPILHVADLTLDPASRKATRGGRTIALSATEYALLECLMRHAGRVLPRKTILEHVWQYDFDGRDNVLDVYIGYLRNKIDRGYDTALVQTIRGVGFRLGNPNAL